MFIRNTVPALDWRTDGRTELAKRHHAVHADARYKQTEFCESELQSVHCVRPGRSWGW